jgi:tetratricopeptide (TPR) repeat protein
MPLAPRSSLRLAASAACRRLPGSSRAARALSTAGPPRHNFGDPKIGIGYLQLPPEETRAEQELLAMLPEFQEAAALLHGGGDSDAQLLPNSKRAELALPALHRTVDICRSAMGHNSVYLLAALRHLALTLFQRGDYEAANRVMRERGELMQWPVSEHERMLRFLLRQNRPAAASDWCQKDHFTALFPQDDTVPLKWTIYELIGTSLRGGASELAAAVDDPLFTDAVDTLRSKKCDVRDGDDASESLLAREIPYLTAQYASLCVVASGALATGATNGSMSAKEELTDHQKQCLQQAEDLWKDALAFTSRSGGDEAKEELTTGVDSPFEAWIETNLGEVLLAQKKPEEAMEFLGKALTTQKQDKSGNALGLARVLSKIAVGCHAVGQAVSSEGLFTTVVESFEKEAFLSVTDQLEYAHVLRAYGQLLADWEKREGDAAKKIAQAEAVEQQVLQRCKDSDSSAALHPIFYLPL